MRAGRGVAALAGTVLFGALVVLLVRQVRSVPGGLFPSSIRAGPALLGMLLYSFGYAVRAGRLNALLPRGDRLGFGRAWSLSGAITFLLQVVPFRGGEVAAWALLKRELGLSWPRAGAVLALVKVIDTATLLLVGLGGGAIVAIRRGAPVLGGAAAAACAAGAVLLALLPYAGSALLSRIRQRLGERPRLARFADEVQAGLLVARERPRSWALAWTAGLGFFVFHLVALKTFLGALGVGASVPGIALASLASVASAAIPSPAGTFGPMESGFSAGLTLEGIPLGTAVSAAATPHLATTLVTGLLALPLLRRRAVSPSSGTASPG